MTRYTLVIDKIVAYKGGVVPDFCVQHAGYSKRKRKATELSRMYQEPTVSGDRGVLTQQRSKRSCVLKAQEMLSLVH
jgi:hypothetical protein